MMRMEQEQKQIDDAIIELLEAETRFEGEIYARVCPHHSGQTVVRDAQRGRNVDHIVGPPCIECAHSHKTSDTDAPEWVRVEAADPIPAATGMTALELLGSEENAVVEELHRGARRPTGHRNAGRCERRDRAAVRVAKACEALACHERGHETARRAPALALRNKAATSNQLVVGAYLDLLGQDIGQKRIVRPIAMLIGRCPPCTSTATASSLPARNRATPPSTDTPSASRPQTPHARGPSSSRSTRSPSTSVHARGWPSPRRAASHPTSPCEPSAPNATSPPTTPSLALSIPSFHERNRARSTSSPQISPPSDQPEKILDEVKSAIRQAVGPIITVSCGIAPSAYLAKTAAEANKPDAAVVWRPADIPEVYDSLDLDDLPGLGPATEARLRRRGIDTVAKLYHAQRAIAQWAWGSTIGRDVHKALHGEPWNPRRKPRQRLSHGRVLEPELRSWDAARPVARFLVTVTLHRCAYEQVAPGRLILEVLGEQGRGWTAGANVEPTNDEPAALKSIAGLWDAIGRKARDVPFKIGLTATRLREWPPRQFELFERRENRVQGLLHTVRDRFGAKAITVGDSLDRTGPYTGLKISFEHIPATETFRWLGVELPTIDPP